MCSDNNLIFFEAGNDKVTLILHIILYYSITKNLVKKLWIWFFKVKVKIDSLYFAFSQNKALVTQIRTEFKKEK